MICSGRRAAHFASRCLLGRIQNVRLRRYRDREPGVSRRTARSIALVALGATFLCVVLTMVGMIARPSSKVGPSTIVVVGDASTPSMQEVYRELQTRVAQSTDFNRSGGALDL